MSEKNLKNHFQQLWQGKHVQENASATAATEAAESLASLDTEQFSNLEVAEQHGEYARIAVMAALSAVKKAESWEEAREYLLLALSTVQDHYPLATDAGEAEKRDEYWEPVYGENWAQLSALMDVLELSKLLVTLYPEKETFAYFRAVHQALFESIASAEKNREILVLMINHGTFEVAVDAFEEYSATYGPESEQFSVDQWITLATLMSGRYLDRGMLSQSKNIVVSLGKVLITQKGYSLFGVREFFKNISEKQRVARLDKQMATWYVDGASDDTDVRARIEALCDAVFVGLGSEVTELDVEASR